MGSVTPVLAAAWPWAATGVLAFALVARKEGYSSGLLITVPAFFWVVLFAWTGDRRLFFPFAMQLAHASSPIPLAVAFFAVRIQQGAAPHVLLVEFCVAVAVLATGHVIQRQRPSGRGTRLIAASTVSILALLGLVL